MNLTVEAQLGLWAPGKAGPPSLTYLAQKLQCVGPDIQFLFFAFHKIQIIKSEPISSAETALNKVSQRAMQFKNNEYIF